VESTLKSLALHGFDEIHDDMKERNIKRKERMRDVMDDGVCKNQRVLSCQFFRFCSLKSLYRLQLDFGLYLSVAKIFYFYLIN